jgi:hypothetical protein
MRFLILLPLLMLSLEAQDPKQAEDDDPPVELAKIRRVYVDLLTGGESALKIRDLLMSSLHAAKLFLITEDEEKADAVLKGSAEDTVFTQAFSSTEGLNAHSQLSLPDITTSSANNTTTRSSNRGSAGLSIGENESHRSEERRHEAMVTVRLVTKDGDVIWSTTQESLGGKFMGASADVADKVARKLATDMRLAKSNPQ